MSMSAKMLTKFQLITGLSLPRSLLLTDDFWHSILNKASSSVCRHGVTGNENDASYRKAKAQRQSLMRIFWGAAQ
eukprot:6173182-Pleurochrysis_carterae.AAC.1